MHQGKEVAVEISSRSSFLITRLLHSYFAGRACLEILNIFVCFVPLETRTLILYASIRYGKLLL